MHLERIPVWNPYLSVEYRAEHDVTADDAIETLSAKLGFRYCWI